MDKEIEEKRAAELVDMLDKLMSEGSGRVKITSVDENSDSIQVNTINSSDCGTGACCQPTELQNEENL